MRVILFRGKRVDNGEWIEGFYAQSGEKKYILIDNDIAVGYLAMKEVNPDTIGQYTGLTDKNGVKIFEGDIIKTKKYGKIIGHSNVNSFDIFVVIYEPAMFRLENTHRAFSLVDKCGKGIEYEVVGNIHDSPEIL